MWKYAQEDRARAVRIVYNPVIGHIAICRNTDNRSPVPWVAYPNDDYANRTGEIAFYADTKEDLIIHAKFREVPTCGCEHAIHDQSFREHPMYREVIDPGTARRALHVGQICNHCADTHMKDLVLA